MQIKALLLSIYKFYAYSRSQEILERYRNIYNLPMLEESVRGIQDELTKIKKQLEITANKGMY